MASVQNAKLAAVPSLATFVFPLVPPTIAFDVAGNVAGTGPVGMPNVHVKMTRHYDFPGMGMVTLTVVPPVFVRYPMWRERPSTTIDRRGDALRIP